jgi:hypothetical protein
MRMSWCALLPLVLVRVASAAFCAENIGGRSPILSGGPSGLGLLYKLVDGCGVRAGKLDDVLSQR